MRTEISLRNRQNQKELAPFLFGFVAFIVSYYYGGYWVLGDQQHYNRFYDNIGNYNIKEGLVFYRSALGASEPVYYLFVYFLSPFIEKLLLFSIVNFVLAFFMAKILIKIGIYKMLLILFVFNFYLVVLYTGAERLKLAATFLIIGLNFTSKKKFKFIFIILGVLSHFQVALLLPAIYSKEIRESLKENFLLWSARKKISILITTVFFIIIFLFFDRALINKISGRVDEYQGWSNIIKPFVFVLLAIFYSKKRNFDIFISFLPLLILAYYVGDFRITILAYAAYLPFVIRYKKGLNFGLIIPALFFTYKGIVFLKSIIVFGYGKF